MSDFSADSSLNSSPLRPRALYVLARGNRDLIYGPSAQADIAALVDAAPGSLTRDELAADLSVLADIEIILSGWGGPILDSALLDAAPKLRGFFYGSGATGGMVGAEAYARGITVVSAADANAVPVAEYTVASIIFALKQAFRFQRDVRAGRGYPRPRHHVPGGYDATVGLVSLGAIGRLVVDRLRGMQMTGLRILAYDPFVSDGEMRALGVERADALETVFTDSDVVSLHTPWLPETERLIRGAHLQSMREGATFINTARGAVVAEDEMIAALQSRPDLTAVLDVVYPEPPPQNSPIYDLPNVFLTPHIAGSVDTECRRMGRLIADELRRYLSGEPLQHEVRPDAAAHSSHRVRPIG